MRNGLEMEKTAESILGCDRSLLDSLTTENLVDEARAAIVSGRPAAPERLMQST